MTPDDNQELQRISTMLAAIHQTLPGSSPLREGLVKAGLALSIAFLDGRRDWIENAFAHLNDPLSPEQKMQLQQFGIDPGA